MLWISADICRISSSGEGEGRWYPVLYSTRSFLREFSIISGTCVLCTIWSHHWWFGKDTASWSLLRNIYIEYQMHLQGDVSWRQLSYQPVTQTINHSINRHTTHSPSHQRNQTKTHSVNQLSNQTNTHKELMAQTITWPPIHPISNPHSHRGDRPPIQ